MNVVGTEILRAVQGDEYMPTELPERVKPAALVHRLECRVKNRKEELRFNRIEHSADVVVTGNARHLEQRLAVRPAMPRALLQLALMCQKRRALHKEDRECRHADVGHSITRVVTRPLVRQTGTRLAQRPNQPAQSLHIAVA
jgi:hypothetical protein